MSDRASERSPRSPDAKTPAEAGSPVASEELERISAQRIRRARETTAALDRISQEPTSTNIAALHELHASHLREAGDERTAVLADERAERAKQLATVRFDLARRPEFSPTLAASDDQLGLAASKGKAPRRGSPGRAGEATPVQHAVAGTQRAAAALQRAMEGSERADAYEAREKSARERSAAARRRLQSAKARTTASALRSPAEERRTRSGKRHRTADVRDRLADERERIADEREQVADARDKQAEERDKVADRREKAADHRDRVADKQERVAGEDKRRPKSAQ